MAGWSGVGRVEGSAAQRPLAPERVSGCAPQGSSGALVVVEDEAL